MLKITSFLESRFPSPSRPVYTPPANSANKLYDGTALKHQTNKIKKAFNLRKIIYNLTRHK